VQELQRVQNLLTLQTKIDAETKGAHELEKKELQNAIKYSQERAEDL